jgi:GMP synthase (glutamine-hydrolysing)
MSPATLRADAVVPERPAHQLLLLIDFGSQYTQLIARRFREAGVYCEIVPFHLSIDKIRAKADNLRGIVLSGGPSSVYEEGAPTVDPALFSLGVPVLGVCYGAQLMAHLLGGKVQPADRREYGRAEVAVLARSALLSSWREAEGSSAGFEVWMSHGDHVDELPSGFQHVARSQNCEMVMFEDAARGLYAVQFHPEVAHTKGGEALLRAFAFDVCGCVGDWSMASFIDEATSVIRAQVGPSGRVICALSGGVDSSVTAALLHHAIGHRLICIFVDNGLLRRGEREQVRALFGDHFRTELHVIDAASRFLEALHGVTDPEKKRKIIGNLFVEIFEEEARGLSRPGPDGARPVEFLAQGTLYPDVIESVSSKGSSAVIKSHHNVGGLPERMNLSLVEPLRELFKDEVRRLGAELEIPRHLLSRQPFPGPGLAVRCLGELTHARLEVLRGADAIIEEEIRAAGLYESIWQSFGVLLPVRSVGVMGDLRTYEEALALRAVHSVDGMTADWVELPYPLLARISNRVINEVRGINRVVYDITSKPPGTIEWE